MGRKLESPSPNEYMYKCRLCERRYKLKGSIVQHIQSIHSDEVDNLVDTGDAEGGSSSSEFEENAEGEEEEDEEEDEKEQHLEMPGDDDDAYLMPKNKGVTGFLANIIRNIPVALRDAIKWAEKETASFSQIIIKLSQYAVYCNVPTTLLDEIKWAEKERKGRLCGPDETIFECWKSSFDDWSILDDSESECYEPVTKDSIPLRVEHLPADVDATFHRIPRYSVLPLYEFQQGKPQTSSTFFVGGPVWAMTWCPISAEHPDADQYAAIACHRTMDGVHKVGRLYTTPGMVQLWCFGKLTNTGASCQPYLSIGLAHDYGCIWDLKWCPSGCWDDPSGQGSSDEAVGQSAEVRDHPRLGLLGMACSDGTVRVMSVPHPRTGEHQIKGAVYKCKPVVSLLPCVRHGEESAPWFGQCWSLEWLPGQKHTKIVAGFSNGTVALWDLCATSSFVCTKSPTEGDILYPIKVFAASDGRIRALSWCASDPHYIAVSCVDKTLSVWDLRDTSLPVHKHVSSLHVDIKWPTYWPGYFASVDDSFRVARTYTMVGYHECGYYDLPIFAASMHKSIIWSIDLSDWLNGLMSVDGGGDVSLMLLPPMCYDLDNTKDTQLENRRRTVYYTELEKLSPRAKQKINCKSSLSKTPGSSGTEAEVSEIFDRNTPGEGSRRNQPQMRADPVIVDLTVQTDAVEGAADNDSAATLAQEGESEHPVIIKTEPVDPEETVAMDEARSDDIMVESSQTDKNDASPCDIVEGGDKSASSQTDNQEANTDNDFQNEIAQLLQVYQQVQQSLNEPATPADSALGAEGDKSPKNDGHSPATSQNNAGTNKKGTERAEQDTDLGGKKKKKKSVDLPGTYEEMECGYGLVYHDIDMSHLSNSYKLGWKMRSIPRFRAKGMSQPHPAQFPLQALHKVSCNPNFGSHFWVLSAGQAGIVRAHCMVGLHKDRIRPCTKLPTLKPQKSLAAKL